MSKRLICKYCGDPILDFQKKTMRDGMHKGCAELKKANDRNQRP